MREAQIYIKTNKNRISFDPMALPGCAFCGAIEVATSPDGREYTRAPAACCITRVVHKASIAASYLETTPSTPPPWLERKGNEEDLHEWHQARAAFRAEGKAAWASIQAFLAAYPAPKAHLEDVAEQLKGNTYKVSVIKQLQARYAAE